MPKHYIIPIFVPHFGCPHDCVFCNQKKITGLSTSVKPEHVEKIILEHLETFKDPSTIELAFFGGSFTAIDMDIQRELLAIPLSYKKMNKIHKIRLSTRPDAIDRQVLDMLKEHQVDIIELGVQSLDDQVLDASGRGHTSQDLYRAAKLIREYDIKLGLQMMLGLPGDTREKALETAREFVPLDPFCVRIYPTLVIRDTYLEKSYLEGSYKPMDLEEAVDLSSELLMIFWVNHIDVIRIGLQPTENIQMGKDVVAGPFHPAFRQLVEGNIYRKILVEYLDKLPMDLRDSELLIEAHNKIISSIAGQGGENRKFIQNRYSFKKIKILGNKEDRDRINISIKDHSDIIRIKDWVEAYLEKRDLFHK